MSAKRSKPRKPRNPQAKIEIPRVMTIPQAGKRYLNLERGASYQAARCKMLPTIQIGPRRFVVSVAVMEKLVSGEGEKR